MERPKNLKVIIGLGNPGLQYQYTRHNIGFRVLDALADEQDAQWHKKDKLEYAEIIIKAHKFLLIKPQTFMNNSGEIVPFLQKKGIKSEELLVVHDELEKPFGSLTFKYGGSHKGHNGLRSLMAHCSGDFWRLRFGIARPEDKAQVSDYVLSKFTQSNDELNNLISKATDILKELAE
jgi:PTH1 family peptidyl-tRNA hydrolase